MSVGIIPQGYGVSRRVGGNMVGLITPPSLHSGYFVRRAPIYSLTLLSGNQFRLLPWLSHSSSYPSRHHRECENRTNCAFNTNTFNIYPQEKKKSTGISRASSGTTAPLSCHRLTNKWMSAAEGPVERRPRSETHARRASLVAPGDRRVVPSEGISFAIFCFLFFLRSLYR